MKSRMFIVLLAAAALLVASSAMAVLPAAHQAGNNAYYQSGDCAACHIPHKAPAVSRGFPINPSDTATYGYVGAFCLERCHLAVAGATGDGGDLSYADVTQTVADNIAGGATGATVGSHGLNLYNSGANAPNGTTVSTSLPYGAGGSADPMECTTCHNPHSDAADSSTALLQADMDILCTMCHTSRVPGGFTTTWGANYGSANPGSHPVGTDVDNDSDTPANSGIRVGIGTAYGSTAFDLAYGTDTNHNLGGHLWDGATGTDASSPISCVSCHAPHGTQIDPGDAQPATGGPVSEDLLVIAQGAMGTADPDMHANGEGDNNNALCEGCHTQGAVVNDWNPGATAFSHPADDMANSLDMGDMASDAIAGSTTEWPFGPVTGTANIGMGANAGGGGPRVICESCHTPHPAANSGLTDYSSVPASGTHILRRAEGTLCEECHLNTPPGHHPVGATLMSDASMSDAAIGNGDGALTCGDCHNATSGGAHNWQGDHFPGLDPDWEPNNSGSALYSDNGRGIYEGGGATLTPGTDALVYTDASKECFDCHTSSRISPTEGNAGGNDSNTEYEAHGLGTHFLGETTTAYMAAGLYEGAAFNANTGDWNTDATLETYSRFGSGTGGVPELVCESCHSIRISSFEGTNTRSNVDKLLVAGYSEGNQRQNTAGRYESGLCEGCHNRIAGGSGSTHVLTGDTVDRSTRLQASGPLSTDAPTLADQTGAPNDGEYVAVDALNCDGCHQPHDAATNAGTMILDTATANVDLAGGVGSPRSAAVNLYGAAYTRSVAADHQWGAGQSSDGAADTFCSQCHNW